MDGKMGEEIRTLEIDLDGVTWSDVADCADARAVVSLPFKLNGQVLRYTPRRQVVYVPGRPALVVKRYFHRGPVDLLKNICRGAPALREWRALREAERRGLAVPKALALGGWHQGSTRQSLLVTRFIDDAASLEDFPGGQQAPQKKWRIIRQAALSIRDMHDKGCYQRDLHLGNLLYRDRGPDPKLFFLDLQRVEVDPLRPMARRWRDLAVLHGGCTHASRSDRLRFLKAYLSDRPLSSFDERRLVQRLEKAGQRHRLRIWHSRQKRCTADNREFCRLQKGDFRGFFRRSASNEEMQSLLADPGRMLSKAALVKDSRTTTVGTVGFTGNAVFVKRYNYQGVGYALKDIFRASRAKRVWRAANSCVLRGVNVALPVAYLERRRWRVLRESYLITAAAAGDELTEVLARHRGDWRSKRDMIRALALMLRKMHERGVAHRDLKAENIIGREEPPGDYKLAIVDFDGLRVGPVFHRSRIRNLRRLNREFAGSGVVNRTDRLRFLKDYLGSRFNKGWKRYWSAISAK